MDSAIQPLYNWALAGKGIVCMDLRFDDDSGVFRACCSTLRVAQYLNEVMCCAIQ